MTWTTRSLSSLNALGRQLWIVVGTLATGIVVALAVAITMTLLAPWIICEYLEEE